MRSAVPDNIALAEVDLSLDVIHYAGPFEFGGSLRRLTFAGADVGAAITGVRLDARVTPGASTAATPTREPRSTSPANLSAITR